ncbi:MAG TPA: hypothetical protein VN324_03105 [Quisquiliibacterium sp.]|nr:hypothetical protein [Quisquiliibacterium sp.]
MTSRSKLKGRAGSLLLFVAALLSAAALLPASVAAQPRTFSEPTKLGTLEILAFPQARLDGKVVQLAPGVRIRNESNLLAMPSSIRGPVAVRYRTEPTGQVVEAWILTAEELRIAKDEARKRAATR